LPVAREYLADLLRKLFLASGKKMGIPEGCPNGRRYNDA
jgi:hypothetical protein